MIVDEIIINVIINIMELKFVYTNYQRSPKEHSSATTNIHMIIYSLNKVDLVVV